MHLLVCDLFLPEDVAAGVCAGLRLPALENMLARGTPASPASTGEGASLETLLCEAFGVQRQTQAPIAPFSAAFDGLGEGGGWLRADPVHLRLQRDQMVLLPETGIEAGEAGQLCAALNEHFAGQGMEFFAPHPQRWYIRVAALPDIETVPLSQAAGRNVRDLLPKGRQAAHWHRIFNEIQMLLFAHPVNEARETRGELPVNSLWLWGCGCTGDASPQRAYDCVGSDETLAEMLAVATGITFAGWSAQWRDEESCDRQLLVWVGLRQALRRGDLDAWRAALQEFETGYAQPLWRALRAGRIAQLQLDILGGSRVRRLLLPRSGAWSFWRRARPLVEYSMVRDAASWHEG
ncbi:MAG: hypothetical protein A3F73_04140 [Gallionellales bacterium RIFCSPLOWO2_12_FULL_59_22]|nr:MAG: hypothetical protein A3H99_00855 [Gallionellales bacterium RIFCSPLOWO2_02_FULL_59_110]OGT03440.1 MAG: hypothetical protein A2Z65_03980 [Gallionellales bacterium RIFCSPLOWO2_02_58_13]OGT12740.1 MAG: hypothetical protein A3F73_04140 [Gallionellales bacterium RIFCSPLOWO2_12_FULL_59_22]